MTLEQFLEHGAYLNAGFVDIYNGKHVRLGEVTPGGDLVLTPAGEAFEPVTAEEPQPDAVVSVEPVAKKPRKAKAEAAADVPPVTDEKSPEVDLAADLDSLLNA